MDKIANSSSQVNVVDGYQRLELTDSNLKQAIKRENTLKSTSNSASERSSIVPITGRPEYSNISLETSSEDACISMWYRIQNRLDLAVIRETELQALGKGLQTDSTVGCHHMKAIVEDLWLLSREIHLMSSSLVEV